MGLDLFECRGRSEYSPGGRLSEDANFDYN